MKIILILLFIFWMNGPLKAQTEEFLLKEGSLLNIAPPLINKDYYLFEYGFVVRKSIKKWTYDYNAFVTTSLFEDWNGRTDNLHAGALGFKGGVLFPFFGSSFFYRMATGFSKTVLHKNPVFGKEEQSVDKKTMVLFEAGGLYKFDHFFTSANYQITNVKYFNRHLIISIGVNY